jgi:hypothetical protein
VTQGFRGCVHGNGPARFVVPGLVPGIHDLSKAIVGCGSVHTRAWPSEPVSASDPPSLASEASAGSSPPKRGARTAEARQSTGREGGAYDQGIASSLALLAMTRDGVRNAWERLRPGRVLIAIDP